MKCMARSTLGVVIGILNIVVYFLLCIGCIINLVDINSRSNRSVPYDHWNDNEYSQQEPEISVRNVGNTIFSIILFVCLIMILISGLLVMGIVKKRHTLMAPWIILSIIGFVFSCIRAVVLLITMVSYPMPAETYLYILMIVVVILGVEAMIIYPIYTLYRDLRRKRDENPGQVISVGNVGFTTAYPVQSYYAPIPAKA